MLLYVLLLYTILVARYVAYMYLILKSLIGGEIIKLKFCTWHKGYNRVGSIKF